MFGEVFFKNLNKRISEWYKNIDNNLIEKIGINKITPIVAILLFFIFAFSLNKFTHLVGDLLPGKLCWYSSYNLIYFSDNNDIAEIWSKNTNLKDINEVDIYINSKIQTIVDNSSSIYTNLKNYEEKIVTYSKNIEFCKFLIFYTITIGLFSIRYQPKKLKYIRNLFMFFSICLFFLCYFMYQQRNFVISSTYFKVKTFKINLLSNEQDTTKSDSLNLIKYIEKVEACKNDLKEFENNKFTICE